MARTPHERTYWVWVGPDESDQRCHVVQAYIRQEDMPINIDPIRIFTVKAMGLNDAIAHALLGQEASDDPDTAL